MRTTAVPWATGLVLILATCQACGGATAVDDLAKSARGVDDAARLADDLEAVNGGKTKIDPKVLEKFEAESGVVADIQETVEPVVDIACDAFEQNEKIVPSQSPPLSQQWLDDLWREADKGVTYKDAVKFACVVNEFKF